MLDPSAAEILSNPGARIVQTSPCRHLRADISVQLRAGVAFLDATGPTKPCILLYKTASISQILRKLQYSGPFGGVLGPLRGPFGRDLGACRRNFDGFKLTIQNRWKRLIYISECDTRTVAHWGPSWAVLGPILGARGPILGPFWTSLGPSRAISKVQKPTRSDKTENA